MLQQFSKEIRVCRRKAEDYACPAGRFRSAALPADCLRM